MSIYESKPEKLFSRLEKLFFSDIVHQFFANIKMRKYRKMNDFNREPRVNLHTHTARCKHASGSVDDYCREAVKAGITILGFTEHTPFPDKEYYGSRMDFSEMPDYVREIEEVRVRYPQLTILTGLELDYRPILGKQFYLDEFIHKYDLDYVIAGVHFLPAANGRRAHYVTWSNPMPLDILKAASGWTR